jgi:hypothetical protein
LIACAKAIQRKALADETALAEAPSSPEEEERERLQQQVDNLFEVGECLAHAMESENSVAEDEDMLDIEDNVVFAETNENEVQMLAPLRDKSERRMLISNTQHRSASPCPQTMNEVLIKAWDLVLVQLASVSGIVEVVRYPGVEVERSR